MKMKASFCALTLSAILSGVYVMPSVLAQDRNANAGKDNASATVELEKMSPEAFEKARTNSRKALKESLQGNKALKERFDRNRNSGLSKDGMVSKVIRYNSRELTDPNEVLGRDVKQGDLAYSLTTLDFQGNASEMSLLLEIIGNIDVDNSVRSSAMRAVLKFEDVSLQNKGLAKVKALAEMSDDAAFETDQLAVRSIATSTLAAVGSDDIKQYFADRLIYADSNAERGFLLRTLEGNNKEMLKEIIKQFPGVNAVIPSVDSR